jgi:REP element-mobilizing transposase RayT
MTQNVKIMADTFSQLYVQLVFAVKGRQSLILPAWEQELYMYIAGIVRKKGQKLLAINGVPDHVHILVGFKPSCCLSDLVREIKKSSNEFIKHRGFVKGNFQWQEGFGAFSYSHASLDRVIAYIQRQKQHHQTQSFQQEYLDFLRRFQIDYNDEHLFDWLE